MEKNKLWSIHGPERMEQFMNFTHQAVNTSKNLLALIHVYIVNQYGLSLLVLDSAPRGFILLLRFSPLLKNQHLI